MKSFLGKYLFIFHSSLVSSNIFNILSILMTTMKIMCIWYCFIGYFTTTHFSLFSQLLLYRKKYNTQKLEFIFFLKLQIYPLFRNFLLTREKKIDIQYTIQMTCFYFLYLKKIIFLLNDAQTALVSFFRLDDFCWLWVGFFSAWSLNISLGWTNIFSDGHFASTDTSLYQKHNRENKMFQHVSMYVSCNETRCFLKYKKIVLISFFLKFSINQLTYAGHA